MRVVTEHMDSVRSVALGFWIGTGSSAEDEPEAGLSHLVEHMLFRGTATATRRSRSTSSSTRWAPSSTRAPARRRRRSTRACSTSTSSEALDVMADMVWRPRFDAEELDPGAPDRPRGDRDVRGRPPGQGVRRPRRGRLRRPPARPRDHRPRRRRGRHARADGWPPSTARATCPRNVVVAAAGSIDHDALVALVAARRGGARAALPPPAPLGAARRDGAAARALPAQGHRAVPRLPRRPGARARRRAPLRAARARQRARRHVVVAAVPGGPREARPGLLASTRSRRCFAGTGEVGLYLGTRPENVVTALRRRRPASSSASARTRPAEAELARATRERQGAHRARRWSRRRRG